MRGALSHMSRAMRRFWRGQDGSSQSMQMLIVFPLLSFALMGTYVGFDAFMRKNVVEKGAYTIGDILSREMLPVDQDYIDGLNDVLDFLTDAPEPTSLRITVVTYDQPNDELDLVWSNGARLINGLSQAEMRTTLAPEVPVMANADTAIIVETWVPYVPIADLGMGDAPFSNIVVTSPRFVPQLKWESQTSTAPGS